MSSWQRTCEWNDDERAPIIALCIDRKKYDRNDNEYDMSACDAVKQYFIEEREKLYVKNYNARADGYVSKMDPDGEIDLLTDYECLVIESGDENDDDNIILLEVGVQAGTVDDELEPLDDPLFRDISNKFAYT